MTPEGAGTRTGHWAVRPWRALRRLSGRTSLGTKLIVALLALVAAAIAAISVTSVYTIRSYLTTQSDGLLQAAISNISLNVQPGSFYRVTGQSDLFVGIQQPGNQLVWANNGPLGMPRIGVPQQSLPSLPTSAGWAGNTPILETVSAQSGSDSWRVIAETYNYQIITPSGEQHATGILVVGTDLGNINATINRLIAADLIVGGIILVVLALVGIGVVRANLRPLDEIEETAEDIAAGHLDRRVPERDPRTEVGSLGRSLNIMLSQIESAFHAQARSEEAAHRSEEAAHRSEERMRRFIADASHELRTPVTAIRGFAEYYRQRGGLARDWEDEAADRQDAGAAAAAGGEGYGAVGKDGEAADARSANGAAAVNGQRAGEGLSPGDLDRIMHRVESEAARMGLLVEDLLLLARLDQQRPLDRRPVDLLSLTGDAVQDARILAPDRAIELTVQPGAAFLVNGDEARLRQVIGNLMSNALTHTPPGTPVQVRIGSGTLSPPAGAPGAGQPAPAAILDVTDQGPGMPPEQAQRVFERFYRADQARTRKAGGSGLGLAIVAGLVAAHGGTVSVHTAPGEGATFRVMLPLAPEALGDELC